MNANGLCPSLLRHRRGDGRGRCSKCGTSARRASPYHRRPSWLRSPRSTSTRGSHCQVADSTPTGITVDHLAADYPVKGVSSKSHGIAASPPVTLKPYFSQ